MELEEAKNAILAEWRKLPVHERTHQRAILFYANLRKQQSDLIDFEVDGNHWQTVHEWLLEDIRNEDQRRFEEWYQELERREAQLQKGERHNQARHEEEQRIKERLQGIRGRSQEKGPSEEGPASSEG